MCGLHVFVADIQGFLVRFLRAIDDGCTQEHRPVRKQIFQMEKKNNFLELVHINL